MCVAPPLSCSPRKIASNPDLENTESRTSPVSESVSMTDGEQLEENESDDEEAQTSEEDDSDGDYDDGENADEDFEVNVKQKPATTKSGQNNWKARGSAKRRHCHPWTPEQEDAVLKHMLQIHKEGVLIRKKTVVELHGRLLQEFGVQWTYSLSGITNAWFRSSLARRARREEAAARIRKTKTEEDFLDEEVGLESRSSRRSRVSANLLAPTMFQLPTVHVSFKNRSNGTHRVRSFEHINTISKLWDQSATAEVFGETRDFTVLSAVIGGSRKALLMAPGDVEDYEKLVESITRAVESSGNAEVMVYIKAQA